MPVRQAMTWERVTCPAATGDGGETRKTVILRNPQERPGAVPGTVVVSGREADAAGNLLDRHHVIIGFAGEIVRRRLVEDLISERLVTPQRESAASKRMRGKR